MLVVWEVVENITESFQKFMRDNNMEFGHNRATIGVQYRARESIVESIEWRLHKMVKDTAVQGSGGMLRLRQWKDRKRRVYEGSGTEAANSGW